MLSVDQARRTVSGGDWSKVLFRDIPEMGEYESRWDIISQFLLRNTYAAPQRVIDPAEGWIRAKSAIGLLCAQSASTG